MKKSVGKEIVIDGSYPITIKFSWEQYDKQRSGGLISGLIESSNSAVDCDASAYIFEARNGNLEVSNCVNYQQLVSSDGSIVHGGDNKGDKSFVSDESITINFNEISPEIQAIVFTLDLLKEQKKNIRIGKLEHTKVSIINSNTGDSINEFNILGIGEKAIQVGKLVRTNKSWIYKPDVIDFKNVSDRKDLLKRININE